MFDAAAFKVTAENIFKEKADALAKQELEELQGITGGMAAKKSRTDVEEEVEDAQANQPDRDAVEKVLNHAVGTAGEGRRHGFLDAQRFVEAMRHESVQACQLSEAEMRGFIAEAEVDTQTHEVAYVEHIKMWVPILFELRKSRVYDGIINKDWGYNATHLIDLWEYETVFPLRSAERGLRPDSAASNRSHRSSRRYSRSNSIVGKVSGFEAGLRRKNSFGSRHGTRPDSAAGHAAKPNRRAASRSGSVRSLARSDSVSSSNSMMSRRSSNPNRPQSRADSSRPQSRAGA